MQYLQTVIVLSTLLALSFAAPAQNASILLLNSTEIINANKTANVSVVAAPAIVTLLKEQQKSPASLIQAANKLLTNAVTNETDARSILKQPSAPSQQPFTSSMMFLVVGAVLVAALIVVAILSALFVMRRRLNTWRLNDCEDTESAASDSKKPSDDNSTVEHLSSTKRKESTNEKDDEEGATRALTSTSSASSDAGSVIDTASSDNNKKEENSDVKVDKKEDIGIGKVNEAAETANEINQTNKENVVSSSSLIATIVNGLSETVASTLESATKNEQ